LAAARKQAHPTLHKRILYFARLSAGPAYGDLRACRNRRSALPPSRVCTSAPVGPVGLKAAAGARRPPRQSCGRRHGIGASGLGDRSSARFSGRWRSSPTTGRHRRPALATASIRALAGGLQAPDARLWRIRGVLDRPPRALRSCRRRHWRTAFAWLLHVHRHQSAFWPCSRVVIVPPPMRRRPLNF
jgi:hypothetical protein